jgi:hypothetical protein
MVISCTYEFTDDGMGGLGLGQQRGGGRPGVRLGLTQENANLMRKCGLFTTEMDKIEDSKRSGRGGGSASSEMGATGWGVRSVPSVSIEATEHQSEAPADGLVCGFWCRLTLEKQYCRLESDAWC